MSHAHHAHGPAAQKKLTWVLLLILGVMVVEFAVGLQSGSLVLLADAGHMLSDAAALSMALFALWFARRPSPPHQTYGYYRIEILAALANALLLALVLFFVVREAIERLSDPQAIPALPVLVIGIIGLSVNIVAAVILHADSKTSLNIRGAYLEVVADALGSVGVIVSAALQMVFDLRWADPAVSLLIAILIAPRIWFLLRDATDILMEAAPRDLDIEALREAMLGHEGVLDIHDLHVWTIASGRVCLSVHIVSGEHVDRDQMISSMNGLLRSDFNLEHATLQVEGGMHLDGELLHSAADCDPCS